MKNKIFTLIELIVVISLLIILAAIVSISLKQWFWKSRDAKRLETLSVMSKALDMQLNYTSEYPLPDDNVELVYSWETMGYQWKFWPNVVSKLNFLKEIPQDPKDNTYYTYSVWVDKDRYELMVMLEQDISYFIRKIYAIDYTERYPIVKGDKIWIILLQDNTPIEDNYAGSQIWFWSWEAFENFIIKVLFSKDEVYEMEWKKIWPMIAWRMMKKYDPPEVCPEGYIPVPWNPDFNQKGFCVAAYEMSYETVNSLNTSWETDKYNENKTDIVSKQWWYPIVNITQPQAIAACRSIWWHLITNNEWMTIARNIELNPSNWSSGKIGSGNIRNGYSENSILWCIESDNYAEPAGTPCNEKRIDGLPRNVLILTNWQKIWDFAWNVWEHVNKTNDIYDMDWTIDWSYTSAWTTTNNPAARDDPNIDNNFRLQNSSKFVYNSWSWIGGIYEPGGTGNNVFVRWWSAWDDWVSGIYWLSLWWGIDDSDSNAWFRCVK